VLHWLYHAVAKKQSLHRARIACAKSTAKRYGYLCQSVSVRPANSDAVIDGRLSFNRCEEPPYRTGSRNCNGHLERVKVRNEALLKFQPSLIVLYWNFKLDSSKRDEKAADGGSLFHPERLVHLWSSVPLLKHLPKLSYMILTSHLGSAWFLVFNDPITRLSPSSTPKVLSHKSQPPLQSSSLQAHSFKTTTYSAHFEIVKRLNEDRVLLLDIESVSKLTDQNTSQSLSHLHVHGTH
jgi:hypothetical protein